MSRPRPLRAAWRLLLRRAGLDQTVAYLDEMARTFPRAGGPR